jgi:uncharacterized protein YecE (DUF72 family)
VDQFGGTGSALERYATRFDGVEVNSSFHRSHRSSTWARWADSVSKDFRFAVKIPKRVTHERKLAECSGDLDTFIAEVAPLGSKLAILLVQLPPSLQFRPDLAEAFFGDLRAKTPVNIVCEPRHVSWFEPAADRLMQTCRIARAAADPSLSEEAARPGGWRGLDYWRLHGSPQIYRSPYGEERVRDYARRIVSERRPGADAWCVFDNTASGAAACDAIALSNILAGAKSE